MAKCPNCNCSATNLHTLTPNQHPNFRKPAVYHISVPLKYSALTLVGQQNTTSDCQYSKCWLYHSQQQQQKETKLPSKNRHYVSDCCKKYTYKQMIISFFSFWSKMKIYDNMPLLNYSQCHCNYRVAQNKIPHRSICNISATSGLILKIL